MDKSESIKALACALSNAQAEMDGATKGSNNPFFKSKYADLSSVIQAIKEPFTNHGLSYSQFPIESGGRIGIETILMHSSGEWLCQSFTVNLTKQDAQAAGSAITYCRRYGLQSIAGIPSEDDDGNHATKTTKQPTKASLPENVATAVKGIKASLHASQSSGVINWWKSLNKGDQNLAWCELDGSQQVEARAMLESK